MLRDPEVVVRTELSQPTPADPDMRALDPLDDYLRLARSLNLRQSAPSLSRAASAASTSARALKATRHMTGGNEVVKMKVRDRETRRSTSFAPPSTNPPRAPPAFERLHT